MACLYDYCYEGSGTAVFSGEALTVSPDYNYYPLAEAIISGGGAGPYPIIIYQGSGTAYTSGAALVDVHRVSECACCEPCRALDNTFRYFIEYLNVGMVPSDQSLFLHTRDEVPVFQDQITKEYYCSPDYVDCHSDFVTGLLNICGVTDVAVHSFRIWVRIAPAYTLDEVQTAVVEYVRDWYGYQLKEALPGSGVPLVSSSQRRPITGLTTTKGGATTCPPYVPAS